MASIPRLLDALATGSRNSAELQARLGISQPTLSRLVRSAGPLVLATGRARATRYARRRAIPAIGDAVALYRVDEAGQTVPFGALYPLTAGEFAFAVEGHAPDLYPGMPWFLQDMRAQGFMGRAFAAHLAGTLRLAPRLPDWNDDAHLIAMALHGDDLTGNLVVGDASLERFHQRALLGDAIAERDRATAYPRLAGYFLDAPPGSCAGGEQPKFTARLLLPSGTHRAVIVKFSPPGTDGAATRWRDLLIAEHAALELLQEKGIPSATSRLVEGGGRLFLEVARFDRCGDRGRRGLLSLAALDDHHIGRRQTWTDTAMHLLQAGLVSPDDARLVRLLDTFGALIANTDRHLGNLSFFTNETNDKHALAPVYDMLPMAYRPTDQGEVRFAEFRPPTPMAASADVWECALTLAIGYWQRLWETTDLSQEMRAISTQNAQHLKSLQRLSPTIDEPSRT